MEGRKLSRARPRPPGTAQTAKPQPPFAFLAAVPSCEAAEHLQDRAGLAALGLREPRRPCDILRALRDFQRFLRGANPRLLTDASDVLGEADQPAGLLGAK